MFNYHYIKYMYYSYFLFLIDWIQQLFQIYYSQLPTPPSYNSCFTLYERKNVLRHNRIVHLLSYLCDILNSIVLITL